MVREKLEFPTQFMLIFFLEWGLILLNVLLTCFSSKGWHQFLSISQNSWEIIVTFVFAVARAVDRKILSSCRSWMARLSEFPFCIFHWNLIDSWVLMIACVLLLFLFTLRFLFKVLLWEIIELYLLLWVPLLISCNPKINILFGCKRLWFHI